MTRPGHYLKPTGRGTVPGLIVSVVVETRDVGRSHADPRHRTRAFRRAHAVASRHRDGRWRDGDVTSFGTAGGFWSWLDNTHIPVRKTYVFSPIASDSLTLLGFWEKLGVASRRADDGTPSDTGLDVHYGDDRPIVVRRLVFQGRPDIVEYSHDGRGLCWLSGRQFFDQTDEQLAGMMRWDWSGPPGLAPKGQEGERPPGDRCRLWLAAMQRFGGWWGSLGAGPFPRTVPAGSMQFFRSRMGRERVCVHKDPVAYDLERRAAHGGRASTWFFGDVLPSLIPGRRPGHMPPPSPYPPLRGPVTCYDIRSTYPWLLRDMEFPVKIVKLSERFTVEDVAELSKRHVVVADVELRTDRAEYPHRVGGDVIYPTGRFNTTLTGPELNRALADREVLTVYRAAYYQKGRPFEAAADLCLKMRADARAAGDTVWETMVKLLGNSLAGKLAQRPLGWVRVPGQDGARLWGADICCNADTREVRRLRYIGGLCFERTTLGIGKGTLTACFALLTSHCRYHMRLIRESLPDRSVLSQDTDGLWVSSAGASALAAGPYLPHTSGAGELCKRSESRSGRWLDPKHYLTDLGWVLAGYHRPTVESDGWINDTYTLNTIRCGPDSPPTTVEERVRRTRLGIVPAGGHVGPDGWWVPARLPELPGRTLRTAQPQCPPPPGLFG